MAEAIELRVEPRDTIRKRLNALRHAGMIPANVYGRGLKSIPVQIERKTFQSVVAPATPTTVINLKIGESGRAQPVLVREIQRNPRNFEPLHVDFFAVRLEDRVRAAVPIVLRGTAPASKHSDTMVAQPVNQIHLEGRPQDLPDVVDVDVSGLTEVDQALYARDLRLPDPVTLLDNPDEVIVKVQRVGRVVEEVKPAKAAEEAAPAEGPAEESPEQSGRA